MKKITPSKIKFSISSFIIIVVLVALIIGISAFNIGKKQTEISKSPIPIIDISKISNNNYDQKILGQQIFNWTGKIVKKNNDSFVLEVKRKNKDGQAETKEITVNINNQTNIFKWDLTKTTSNDANNSDKTLISYDNLTVGHTIVARSSQDVNEKSEITPNEIDLLITP